MLALNITILYVDDPSRSAAFYADIFNCQPVQASPTFVLFAFPNGASLGLWSRHTVEPVVQAVGPGGELAFVVEDVDGLCAAWTGMNITIIQQPTTMGFGYGFTALDPDGHRLRAFCPASE